jgi:hypothetical protein
MTTSAAALADRRAAATPPARPAPVHPVARPLPRPLPEEQAWARAAAARSGFGASETVRETPPA